jgi:hypothetical protein
MVIVEWRDVRCDRSSGEKSSSRERKKKEKPADTLQDWIQVRTPKKE